MAQLPALKVYRYPQQTLYTAVMDSMHHLTPVAHQMMKTPISPGRKNTGCPTFEWRD